MYSSIVSFCLYHSPLQLLEVCRRLDAMEANGFPDSMEEAEVAALRVMVDVSL